MNSQGQEEQKKQKSTTSRTITAGWRRLKKYKERKEDSFFFQKSVIPRIDVQNDNSECSVLAAHPSQI